MRDLDTISTALTAAETGHLVFATLHTQDTAQTIDRIIDVFRAPAGSSPRAAVGCAAGDHDPAAAAECGRLGAGRRTEVLVPNPAVRNLIREGKTHQIYSVLQTGSATGMQTMDASLATLVRSGQISRKLAEWRSSTPEESAACSAPRRSTSVARPRGQAQMSTYVFKAMDVAGIKARGELEGDSKQAVSDQLKQRGLIVLEIAEHVSREIELCFAEVGGRKRPSCGLPPARRR